MKKNNLELDLIIYVFLISLFIFIFIINYSTVENYGNLPKPNKDDEILKEINNLKNDLTNVKKSVETSTSKSLNKSRQLFCTTNYDDSKDKKSKRQKMLNNTCQNYANHYKWDKKLLQTSQ
jgi:hypothetical protein|tara:strand:- start:2080 stop:2442 length:363 start_codon:yes stop_codon:yes gene_type:complete